MKPVPARVSLAKRRPTLRQRTLTALRLEIAFIPAAEFQSIDLAEAIAQAEREISRRPSSLNVFQNGSSRHIAHLCTEPLLDAETERQLFCLMNFLKFRANSIRSGLSSKRPSRSKLDRIDQLNELALALRNRIVRANVRLVVSLVKKYANEVQTFDDLVSEGISCLMNAAEKFDFSRGYRFSTYATRAITRDMFRFAQRRHRERTRFVSGSAQMIFDGAEQRPSQRDEATWLHLDDSIAQLMKRLDERERFIVRARFGFDPMERKATFSQIGKLLGVSKERVRQLESRAISKLREAMDEFQLDDAI